MWGQNLLIVFVSLLVVASAIFMGWAAFRTDDPVATPATAESISVPTAAPPATDPRDGAWQEGGGIIDAGVLTMTLPGEWRYTTQSWPGEAPDALHNAAPLLIAWQGAGAFAVSPLRFTLIATSRNELSLEQYLVDVTEQLAGTDGVSDISAQISTDLRSDGLPVAFITYTLTTPAGRFEGYQTATFDASGEQIVIGTLLQQGSSDAEQLFRTLVTSIRFVAAP